MPLREEFTRTGDLLFRGRSYLPLLIIGLFLIALRNFKYPQHNQALDLPWEMFCLAISLSGLGIRVFTTSHTPRRTSGRNTKKQVAETLNITGMYSMVRHPLYLGNFFVWLGISLHLRAWWAALIALLLFWIYYERIMFAEEEFLREQFGEAYLRWANRTPAFLPKFRNWRRPDLPFSVKAAISREYTTFIVIIATFTALDIIEDRIAKSRFIAEDWLWVILFLSSCGLYLLVRILKKKTKLLRVRGR